MDTSLLILFICIHAVYGLTDGNMHPKTDNAFIGMSQTDTNQLNDARAILSIENQVIQFEDPLQCVDKMICLLAAQPGRKPCQEPRTPLDIFVNIITCLEHRIHMTSYRKAKSLISDFSKFEALIMSASRGDFTKDESDCSYSYPQCPFTTTELLAIINDWGKATNLTSENPLKDILENFITTDGSPVASNTRVKRSCKKAKDALCGATAGACGASAVGCALASIFSFGFAAAACVPTGVAVCTATGSACTAAASQC